MSDALPVLASRVDPLPLEAGSRMVTLPSGESEVVRMAQDKAADPGLDELLGRLESRDDAEVSRSSYMGRALSKSGKDLRLSTDHGVIAIPLRDITQVNRLSNGDPAIVNVEVKNTSNVTQVVEADPMAREELTTAMKAARRVIVIRGPIIITGDTDTITGGRPDACDDTIVVVNW